MLNNEKYAIILEVMPEQIQEFGNINAAEQYVEHVRFHYRQEHAAYKGRRSEEQQLIAEVTSEEARLIVDGVLLGLLALSGQNVELTNEDQDLEIAGLSWKDFRGEYERLLAGFGVITHRLERDGYDVDSFAYLDTPDQLRVASVLFSDFLEHNSLRFGVSSAGAVKSHKQDSFTRGGGKHTAWVRTDRYKATHENEILRNMRKRGYVSGQSSLSAAGKISPREYIALRLAHPEMSKDDFDFVIGSATNARKELDNRE